MLVLVDDGKVVSICDLGARGLFEPAAACEFCAWCKLWYHWDCAVRRFALHIGRALLQAIIFSVGAASCGATRRIGRAHRWNRTCQSQLSLRPPDTGNKTELTQALSKGPTKACLRKLVSIEDKPNCAFASLVKLAHACVDLVTASQFKLMTAAVFQFVAIRRG